MEEIKEGYTRVSSILGQWNHLAHIDKNVLDNKCRIGTEVHQKIGAEADGIFIETGRDTLGYILSWSTWKNECNEGAKYIATEKRFYCDELKITGCVDAIMEIGDLRVLVDYKTSATANKKMWALQGAFYHYLATKNGIDLDPHVWFIHLKKDGKKAKEIEIHCTEELWEVAKSALHAYRYFNG